MKTSSNNNNIESKNGMSQVINILTGETKKIRCHYLSKRTDKPVSRVLTLERLNHPALTAAGVTVWAERFNDGVNSFDWLRVSIQLTDKICYTPNCANVGLPDVENYGNLDYYKNQEGAMRVSMNNVDKFFQSIADKPAKMMTGEDWPNMAVIAAYRAAGRDEEADTLTAARDIYNARREAKNEAWRKKYAAQQYYYNRPKPKNFDDLTELERAQFMMQTAQECAKDHPELDWADIMENAEKRLEKAKKEEEKAIREAEKAAKEREDATLEPASEITASSEQGIKVGTEVWTTIELNEEYGKMGKVVRRFFADHGVWCLDIEFEDGTKATYAEEYITTEKPWAVVGAKCRHKYLNRDVVLTITAVGQYYGIKAESEDGKVKRCDLVSYFEPVEEITEAEGVKVGDKVRHNKHEEVATVTAIREAFVNGCDGYRYLYTLDFGQSVKGPFDVELNGGEFLREAFTLQEASEIKPKASDSELESLTAKYAKQIEESALLGCGYMVGDGDETRKDSKCVKVRTAYKNDSHDAKDWTYCVSWYETTPIKGDADGQHQTLRECENGILLEQAARHMAYFELMARKGWTLDEILYGKVA